MTIKNIEAVDEVEGVLIQIDILTAIKYYGMTEILDTIGEELLRSHLEECP